MTAIQRRRVRRSDRIIRRRYISAFLSFGCFMMVYLGFVAIVFPSLSVTNRKEAMKTIQQSPFFQKATALEKRVLKHAKQDIQRLRSRFHTKPPMTIDEVVSFLSNWIHTLHDRLLKHTGHTAADIWKVYHDLAVEMLVPWDQDYLQRMPSRRTDDDTIFLSIATYRDENCMTTLANAYGKARYPDRLFVGLVQQNCETDCVTGVLESRRTEPTGPDPDCYDLFCQQHPERCSQVRVLKVNESESLGPYAARYMASKLWDGEPWYMQTDAHMGFLQNWDEISLQMLKNAPSERPVISHYPPGHKMDMIEQSKKPGGRLCGPVFTNIIRLEGLKKWDKVKIDIPRFAPFAAAGYFVAHSAFLKEVPFDPFLPYIFMGEEIIMSTRLWTSGYDMFSPSTSVVNHMYVRQHKPKFWETVQRIFKGHGAIFDSLEAMVLERIRYQLNYPEAQRDILGKQYLSVLAYVEHYSMGTKRPLADYLNMTGIDVVRKEMTRIGWCEEGKVPPGKEEYEQLYRDAERAALEQQK